MNIYIAGPWAHKDDMPAIAKKFEDAGHTITWKWWEHDGKFQMDQATRLRKDAENDVDGVIRADALILVNSAKSEGKAVEQGIAIGFGMPIIAIGKLGEFSVNVFHYMSCYTWVDTVEDAIKELECQQI